MSNWVQQLNTPQEQTIGPDQVSIATAAIQAGSSASVAFAGASPRNAVAATFANRQASGALAADPHTGNVNWSAVYQACCVPSANTSVM